ncbi:MAG: hypothetical protein ACM31E_10825 [Fibrobacterota bacterium]
MKITTSPLIHSVKLKTSLISLHKVFSGIRFNITLFLLLTAFSLCKSSVLTRDCPDYAAIVNVWKTQDSVDKKGYSAAISKIMAGLPSEKGSALQKKLGKNSGSAAAIASLEDLYIKAASARRAALLETHLPDSTKIVYSAHGVWAQIYIDNANEAGGDLVVVTMKGGVGEPSVLVSGQTRDPDVSFDGKRILYAYREPENSKKSYHLYEIDLSTNTKRQITSGGSATDFRHNSDVEGVYLPNDDILFCSTRMIQMGDCLDDGSVTANLFLCNKDGKYLRRISYDQAHICYPSVLSSGQVIYSRWDYNDKNHTYAHGLFTVNPDGTRQMEYYGNNSWWPTALYYPCQIPGTDKIMAIAGGYHSGQSGIVCTVDRNYGIANGDGITLLAPVRLPKDDTIGNWATSLGGLSFTEYKSKWGSYAFDPSKFPKQNAYPNDSWTSGPYTWPYPLDENSMLVCQADGLYFMTYDGQKELIASGSCASPRLIKERKKPAVIADKTDWSKSSGICQIMDINITQAPLLDNIPKGTIKRLRVVALDYRTGPSSGAGGMNCGPGSINNGGATAPIPIAIVGASWDVKKILGETPIESDGSASFYVPARTPVYFQALDDKGHVVQTMRSWTTLMPGENNTCIGCHESKLEAIPTLPYIPLALKREPLVLDSFYGPPRGFSFFKEIQPILDNKCISCHNTSNVNGIDLSRGTLELPLGPAGSWTSSGRTSAKAYQTLVTTTDWDYRGKYVWWQSAEDSPLLQPPYRTGACKSPLVRLLDEGHHDVNLTKEEYDKICAWIDIGVPSSGDYSEGLGDSWVTQIKARESERNRWLAEEQLNIDSYLQDFGIGVKRIPGSGRHLRNQLSLQAYPNPFTNTTVVQFTIPFIDIKSQDPKNRWTLELYNSAGRYIKTIADGVVSTGTYRVAVDPGRDKFKVLAQGTYFCILRAQGQEQAVKLVRVR